MGVDWGSEGRYVSLWIYSIFQFKVVMVNLQFWLLAPELVIHVMFGLWIATLEGSLVSKLPCNIPVAHKKIWVGCVSMITFTMGISWALYCLLDFLGGNSSVSYVDYLKRVESLYFGGGGAFNLVVEMVFFAFLYDWMTVMNGLSFSSLVDFSDQCTFCQFVWLSIVHHLCTWGAACRYF